MENLGIRAQNYVSEIKQEIKNFIERSPNPLELMTNTVSLEKLGHEIIASGAEKHVVIPNKKLGPNTDPTFRYDENKVLYVPVRKWFFSKKNALKKEYKKMLKIKGEANTAHLLVDAKPLAKGEGKIKGHFTLEVDKAERDFEKELTGKKLVEDKNNPGTFIIKPDTLSLKQRLGYCKDYTSGMHALHSTRHAYGDIKPENCLIFKNKDGSYTLKISDFGKCEEVGKGESKTYKGNLRFAPPEGTLSQKGDVYGTALVLIRTLEEAFLDEGGTPLVTMEHLAYDEIRQENGEVTLNNSNLAQSIKDSTDAKPSDKRRGVERLIVEHKAFPGMDEPTLIDKIFRRLPRQASLEKASLEKKQEQHAILEKYITKLTDNIQLKLTENLSDEDIQKVSTHVVLLQEKLMSMIDIDPGKRPDMKEVNEFFETFYNNIEPFLQSS